jgi:hypothetical protein
MLTKLEVEIDADLDPKELTEFVSDILRASDHIDAKWAWIESVPSPESPRKFRSGFCNLSHYSPENEEA